MVGDFIWVKLSSLGQFGMMQAGGDTNPYPPWESHPEKTSPLGSHPWWKYGKSYVTGVIIFLGGLRAEWGMGFWIFSGHIETFQLIN